MFIESPSYEIAHVVALAIEPMADAVTSIGAVEAVVGTSPA